MKILDFGSMNLDYVYSVDHIVLPGETLSSSSMNIFPGGKGLNQAVALARASSGQKEAPEVYMAGIVGEGGKMLLDVLEKSGVDTSLVKKVGGPNGNAVIQVASGGENSIVLYGGSNQMMSRKYIDKVLDSFSSGDIIVLQNEINLIGYIIDKAYEKGMKIVMNPSPFDRNLENVDFSKVSLFFVNEVEASQITGTTDEKDALKKMEELFPSSAIVMTLGKRGAVFSLEGKRISHGIYSVKTVDTTAAGDTFTGFFTQAYFALKLPAEKALEIASKASAIAVSRQGASPSIPLLSEVMEYSF